MLYRVVKDDKPSLLTLFKTAELFPEGSKVYPRVIPPGSRSIPVPVGTEGRVVGYRPSPEDISNPADLRLMVRVSFCLPMFDDEGVLRMPQADYRVVSLCYWGEELSREPIAPVSSLREKLSAFGAHIGGSGGCFVAEREKWRVVAIHGAGLTAYKIQPPLPQTGQLNAMSVSEIVNLVRMRERNSAETHLLHYLPTQIASDGALIITTY